MISLLFFSFAVSHKMRYLLVIIAFAVVVGSQLLFPKFITVKTVECLDKSKDSCQQEILSSLGKVEGMKLYQARDIISNYLNNEPKVLGYSTSYVPLDGLRVEMETRVAEVAISSTMHEGIYALVDSQGYVLEYKNETDLPRLITDGAPPNLGDQLGSDWIFGIEVAKLASTAMGISEVYTDEGGFFFYLPAGTRVWFGKEGDARSLITSLQVILSQSKIVDDFGGNPAEIDLRFSNPVIR